MKEIKQPHYKNEAVLIHCTKRTPHSLIFDEDFIKYDEKTILDLCEDLETSYKYLCDVFSKTPLQLNSLNSNALPQIKEREQMQQAVDISFGLVWAGLYYHHNDIIPEKYKAEY